MSQTALITGGGSGIGQALAYQLIERGWQVFIVGRNPSKLESCQARFPESIRTIQADLEDLDSYEKIASVVAGSRLDCLVHNAAVIEPMASIKKVSLVEFEALMRINVTACLGLTQKLIGSLKNGRVMFISSGAAKQALYEWSAYCTSKAALHMLKLAFQNECADIAFGDVMPGIVHTPMIDHVKTSEFRGVDFFRELHRAGKLLKPEVVGAFLSWLICDVSAESYSEITWDIYDTSHHAAWLKSGEVPPIE